MLLGRSGTADALDAAVISMCRDGDLVLTTNPGDLIELAHADGVHIEIVAV